MPVEREKKTKTDVLADGEREEKVEKKKKDA